MKCTLRREFMKMTCVNRLNYNYYYLAFDVVHESNYKMLRGKNRRKRRYEREAGSLSFQSCKIKFMLWRNSCLESTLVNVLLQIKVSLKSSPSFLSKDY